TDQPRHRELLHVLGHVDADQGVGIVEEELGRAKVVKTFSSGAKKQVLGARLLSGTFTQGGLVKVLRAGEEITRGKIANLQQARANVKEIRTEGEFGTELEAKQDAAPGDELVLFATKTI
ncbi:MAG: hypothetical protein B7W98_02300, partial [Parcubacteria group bacterium 20-58-5]